MSSICLDRLPALAATVLLGVTMLGATACTSPLAAPALPPEAEPGPTTEPPAEAEDHRNNIRWSTASEVENAGFNVYRGDTEDGPFVRLNQELIEGAYTTDEPSYYSFVDRDIDPYRSYFYYVESVSLSGIRENFTPVIAAKPKLPKTSE